MIWVPGAQIDHSRNPDHGNTAVPGGRGAPDGLRRASPVTRVTARTQSDGLFRCEPVVADGVEVAAEPGLAGGEPGLAGGEPGLAGGEPGRPEGLHQAGQQLAAGGATDSAGAAAQVGGPGQAGEPQRDGQAPAAGQRPGVADPAGCGRTWPSAARRPAAAPSAPGCQGYPAWRTRSGQAHRGDGGEQQQQPGVIAGQRHLPGGPAGKPGGLDRLEPGRRAAAPVVAARRARAE